MARSPSAIRSAPKGFELPAARADFHRAERLEPTRDGAKVTYSIKLSRPSDFFALFQKVNPNVRIGDIRQRHATYRKEGRSWILDGTDEKDRKID